MKLVLFIVLLTFIIVYHHDKSLSYTSFYHSSMLLVGQNIKKGLYHQRTAKIYEYLLLFNFVCKFSCHLKESTLREKKEIVTLMNVCTKFLLKQLNLK